MFLCKGLRLAAVRSTASLWSYSRSLSTAQCCQQQQQQKQPANTNADGNVTPAATKPAATGSHRVTSMDRKYLVWSGKYKTAADVPEYVHTETMERANNKTRIRVANIMMLLTVVGCIAMVISGKRASEDGDSVAQRNLDWHKQYNKTQEPKN